MRTVRRIYFYSISLISLEVVIWGLIGLLRTIFNRNIDSGIAGLLASGLSQILVALPIFLFHWNFAQREAEKDEEEKASQVRALFQYGARLAVLMPIVQNLLALLNHLLLMVFDLHPYQALIGGEQTYGDNLAAVGVNLLAFVYLDRVLKSDWCLFPPENALHDLRRLFRVVWMLYTLVLAIAGVSILLHYVFFLPEKSIPFEVFQPVNGLALSLIAMPLWLNAWLRLIGARKVPQDKKSVLRLVSIYLLALIGVVAVLASGAGILTSLVNAVTGDGRSLSGLVNDNATLLAFVIVFGVVWAFFQREMGVEFTLLDDESMTAGLKRVYNYLLSFIGLAAAFAGMQQLLSFVVHFTVEQVWNQDAFRPLLSRGLGLLLIAAPLWVTSWNRAQAGARREDDSGDHARRSPLRKGYLYLVLFLTVVGGMFTAGQVIYLLISRLLGNEVPAFLVEVLNWLQSFLILLVLLVYHLRVLRQDGRMLQMALSRRHSEYPLLMLSAGENETIAEIKRKLAQTMPELPVEVLDVRSLSNPPGMAISALVVDGALLIQPPGWLPVYLASFPGEKIILPQTRNGWLWPGGQRSRHEQVTDAVAAVRQLAEGQTVRSGPSSNPWVVIGYVLGGLFGLQLLLIILGVIINSFS
ncbi:MAG: DUF5671 domain-containing protein [Anaerolineaceae bacterium]